MLYELYVENIALLRQVRLPLASGLNALTGETGAGKSLVVDAVSLLIGGRGSDSFIRSGEDKALVEGTFLPPYPQALLDALGDQADPEDSLILSRELIRGGRSLARLNGRSIPLSRLRELGRLLINIHGQHEHILLLEDERQLALVDGYGGSELAAAAADVSAAYSRLQEAARALKDFERQGSTRRARLEELQAFIDELDAVAPQEGEDERLKEESRLLSCGERLYEQTDQAQAALTAGGGGVEAVSRAAALLRQASALDPRLEALSQRVESLFYEVQDAAEEIISYRDRISTDAWRLDEIESRLAVLGRLCKKYGGILSDVIRRGEEARTEYARLSEEDISGDRLQKNCGLCRRNYDAAAAALRILRQQSAARLSEAVTEQLHLLAMPQARFAVELRPEAVGPRGTESAVFMISPNRGEPAQPVARIASGGELSRIVLGIKVVLSQLEFVPTLVFDEVDTGLSGTALAAVADRLRRVGLHTQALAVSHNPLIAAAAHAQILVEKHEEQERTVADCRLLAEDERPAVLARMLAGDKAGAAALSQARELLDHYCEDRHGATDP